MQLTQNNGTAVISGGVLETNNFTMEIDGKMFRILSDTLYQNKIGSMIREVSCNAADAHIAAGKRDVPFIVHAPNQLEPWFSIKDEGVGLSHDEVISIFSRFGKSTKTDSNTQVGAFGFGSKSPFAYTDTFTVISSKDGMKRNYSAVIQEDGTPAMLLLDASETTDPNGVEVMVGVETSDFRTFYSEIVEQLNFFAVKPTVCGTNSCQFPDMFEHVIQVIDGVHFRSGVYGVRYALAVQGGVSYPIDLSQLNKAIADNPAMLTFMQKVVKNTHPIIMFEIGEVAVTPSREAISYDKRTIDNIVAKLANAQAKMLVELEQKMDSFPNNWERTKHLSANKDLYINIIDYKDNRWGVQCGYGNTPYIPVPTGFNDLIDGGTVQTQHAITSYELYLDSSNRMRASRVDQIVPKDNVIIVIADGTNAIQSRIRRLLLERPGHKVYFASTFTANITYRDKTIQTHYRTDSPVESALDSTAFSNLLDACDGAEFIMLEDLPKVERVVTVRDSSGVPTVKPKYTPAKMYKFEGFATSHDTNSIIFKNFSKEFIAPKKMNDEVTYVIVNNRSITDGLGNNAGFFASVFKDGKWTKPIYAIRDADAEKIKDNPQWVPLADEVAKVKVEYLEKYKLSHVRYAVASRSNNGLCNFVTDHFTNYLNKHLDKVKDPVLKKHLKDKAKQGARASKASQKFDNIGKALYITEIEAIYSKLESRQNTRNAAFNERYEFFTGLGISYWTKHKDVVYKELLEWINFRYEKSLQTVAP